LRAQPVDIAMLVGFLFRHGEKAEAGVWLERLEERVQAQAQDDPKAIAQLVELQIQGGTGNRCEVWITRLEAIDRDPIRPLVARVKYLAARGKMSDIEPTVESILPGKKWLLFGLANDEIGYIIPRRQWDSAPPFAYGRKVSQYGEINSCSPEVAPIIMQALKLRVADVTSPKAVAPKLAAPK